MSEYYIERPRPGSNTKADDSPFAPAQVVHNEHQATSPADLRPGDWFISYGMRNGRPDHPTDSGQIVAVGARLAHHGPVLDRQLEDGDLVGDNEWAVVKIFRRRPEDGTEFVQYESMSLADRGLMPYDEVNGQEQWNRHNYLRVFPAQS